MEVGGRALGPWCYSDWGRAAKARGLGSSVARWCGVSPASSVGGSYPPLVPKQHHRVAFFSGYICPASNPMHLGRSLHWLRNMGRRSKSRAIGMPGITFDATWLRSWMTATHGLPLGVHSPGARRVWRNSYSVFSITKGSPSKAPTSTAAFYTQQRCTCSSQALCWGGGSRSSSSRVTGALSCGISRGGSGQFEGVRSPPLV